MAFFPKLNLTISFLIRDSHLIKIKLKDFCALISQGSEFFIDINLVLDG